MRKSSALVAFVLALGVAVTQTQSSLAGCYGANEGAWVQYTGSTVAKGGSAEVDLYRVVESPGTSYSIVHPFQLASNTTSDFIGWGTYRGKGTTEGPGEPAHITDCPNHTADSWRVYADGKEFDQYFCRASYGTLPSISPNQLFKIKYTTCNGITRFALYLNGTALTCATMNVTSGSLAAGGEVVYTLISKDIDVDYESLHVYFAAGWFFWNSPHGICDWAHGFDGPYLIYEISNIEFEVRSGIN